MSGQVSVWSIWLDGGVFGWMAREECIMKGVTCKYAVHFLLDCSESETHKKPQKQSLVQLLMGLGLNKCIGCLF